jgi:hypothetical protein
MHLLGDNIYKLKPGLLEKRISNMVVDHYDYGHIKVKDKSIRLSTCIDTVKGFIQYPIEEEQYFDKGDYLYLTSGDMFLLVKLSNLVPLHKTDKLNYLTMISSLFEANAVKSFGLIIDDKAWEDATGIHQITKQLPELYMKANLRGCMSGKKPKYILARLENSASPDYFDYELWTGCRDIFFTYKTNLSCHKSLELQAKKNTEQINDRWVYTNLVGKCPGIITVKKDKHYMIFKWPNNLEMIRKYCCAVKTKFYGK